MQHLFHASYERLVNIHELFVFESKSFCKLYLNTQYQFRFICRNPLDSDPCQRLYLPIETRDTPETKHNNS